MTVLFKKQPPKSMLFLKIIPFYIAAHPSCVLWISIVIHHFSHYSYIEKVNQKLKLKPKNLRKSEQKGLKGSSRKHSITCNN